ncbi:polyprenyl synthetase family protein [Helicobacter baculiformis]|uniref:Polyprenyl synthetase family protein n=1 Tax=Helicobacter baculiformis TaxID=427351 RepID=A0ABV7ZG14_9HELI|nr:polyprenyl synthetase family protein [Helicobacter baculiformis]
MLEQIAQRIQQFLAQVQSADVDRMACVLGQGKMLRSKLILAICPKHAQLIDFCAIIEMIQSASLLHDDVIDNAHTRRAHASVNHIFGNQNAIMLGDVFYAKAFLELTKLDGKIAQLVAHSVMELSRGEIKDVMASHAFHSDSARYVDIIQDKSASLIVASCAGAAILAGLDPQAYRIFGLNFGIAFQIMDDLLDITQPKEVLGKPAFNDFKEGKSTLPYILLHQQLDPTNQERLQTCFKNANAEALAWCQEQFKIHGIVEQTLERIRHYAHLALQAIKGHDSLERVASGLIEREF